MYPATANEMYDLCLELLRKQNTSSLDPDEWMIRINSIQLDYVNKMAEKAEQSQMYMDRLKEITVRHFSILNTGNASPGQEIFVLPGDYFRLLNVGFKLNYIKESCLPDGPSVTYEVARPLDSDTEYMNKTKNYYRKPKVTRLYYTLTGQELQLVTGSLSYGLEAKINYVRIPRLIDLNQSPGAGDCELNLMIRNQLCYALVAQSLEGFGDGRYQSFLNEHNKVINP